MKFNFLLGHFDQIGLTSLHTSLKISLKMAIRDKEKVRVPS